MTVELLTERMRLRPVAADDLDRLIALDADPGVTRFIDGGAPVDRDVMAARLDWWLGRTDRFPGHTWIAEDLDTGEFLGRFRLGRRDDDPPDRAELGYRLHRVVWGRGLATEGSSELLRHAFEDLGASLVYGETMTVNLGSRRVLEHVGMRHVLTFHLEWPDTIEGSEEGDVRYEITRAEWEASPTRR